MAVSPTTQQLDEWERELKTVPLRHREDARQEAWVAFLAGGNPLSAIWRYAKNEQRIEKRTTPFQSNDGDIFAVDGKTGEIRDESEFRRRKPAAPRQSIPSRNNTAA